MQLMMQVFFISFLLLVFPSALAQQTRGWTVLSYSECSTACGGGFAVRSVRCLDEDGVIVHDCIEEHPASYTFCNQLNCTTGDSDATLLPLSGSYEFVMENAYAVLHYTPPPSYQVHLVVTESDYTQTILRVTYSDDSSSSSSSDVPSTTTGDDRYSFEHSVVSVAGEDSLRVVHRPDGGSSSGGGYILKFNSKELMPIDAEDTIEHLHFTHADALTYSNGTIYDSLGNTQAEWVSTLFLCDFYRVYRFDGTKRNPIDGSGVLFVNQRVKVAVYFVTGAEDYNTTTARYFNKAALAELEEIVGHQPTGSSEDISLVSGDGSASHQDDNNSSNNNNNNNNDDDGGSNHDHDNNDNNNVDENLTTPGAYYPSSGNGDGRVEEGTAGSRMKGENW